MNNRKSKEQIAAVLIVWMIISIITTIVLIISFFIEKQAVLQLTPTCISKSQFNIECSLCGMSRAFIKISNYEFSEAYNLNNGSIFVYLSFLLNSLIFIIYAIMQNIKKH